MMRHGTLMMNMGNAPVGQRMQYSMNPQQRATGGHFRNQAQNNQSTGGGSSLIKEQQARQRRELLQHAQNFLNTSPGTQNIASDENVAEIAEKVDEVVTAPPVESEANLPEIESTPVDTQLPSNETKLASN